MLLENYLNLASTGTAEALFKVSHDRYMEMICEWEKIEDEIVANHADYSFTGTGQDEGRLGLHGGKVLTRLLQSAKTDNEELLCLFIAYSFITSVIEGIEAALMITQ